MSEMVERVARAIGKTYSPQSQTWDGWLPHARAAIEAMWEPTEAMLAAPYHEGDGCDAQYLTDEDFRDAWQDMIKAALA